MKEESYRTSNGYLMKREFVTRRDFLGRSLALAAGVPLGLGLAQRALFAAQSPARASANVAIVQCRSYGPEVRAAFDKCFDLLGGIGSLVKNKTVTIKLNLTGTDFTPFLNRPVGETYMTHYATALALATALFKEGAKRVRFVESTQSTSQLDSTLALSDWDLKNFEALGKVEFENTRNLGSGKSY